MEHYKNFSLENLIEVFEGNTYHEEWKDVDGYEGYYQVSSFGRVKSFVLYDEGRIRKGVPADGYLQVQLRVNKILETRKVHRLAAKAFIPNPENLPEVNHIRGDRKDNRVWMIEWSTASNNMKHAYRVLGKKNNFGEKRGEDCHNAVFKNADILKMREMFESGEYTQKQIANIYNQRSGIINRILKRKRWKHI